MDQKEKDQEIEFIELIADLPCFIRKPQSVCWQFGRMVIRDVFKGDPLLASECVRADMDYFIGVSTIPEFIRACHGVWHNVSKSGEAESRANKKRDADMQLGFEMRKIE